MKRIYATILAVVLVAGCSSDDGSNATTTPDPCAENTCQNDATCLALANGDYLCQCAAGFTGDDCGTAIDNCADDPCVNGTCESTTDGYTCTCDAGFEGTKCQTNTDDCSGSPCQNGGTCIDGIDAFTCVCPAGFDGPECANNIDDCASNTCLNGSTCVDEINGFSCTCLDGFADALCQTNIDECATNPCMNSGVCTDAVASYTCACPLNFFGDNCECALSPGSTTAPTPTTGSTEGFFLGFEFQPSADVTVHELGVLDFIGDVPANDPFDPPIPFTGLVSAPIALYDSNGIIAETVVTASSTADGGYRWESITPVALTAGQTYAVMMLTGPNAAFSFQNTDIAYDARLTLSRILSTNSNGVTTLPTTITTANGWSNRYFGPNLKIADCP
ncbi:MAG: hypothetical protein R3E66_06965 [bacterium]